MGSVIINFLFASLFSIIFSFAAPQAKAHFRGSCSAGCVSKINLGAGGQVTDIDIVASGGQRYMVARIDVWGAYRKYPGDSQWTQLFTASSGLSFNYSQNGAGPWDIRIAPSNPNIIWMSLDGYMWVSTNAGNTFAKISTSLIQRDPGTPEGTGKYGSNFSPQKFIQNKLAIDPANPNIVYIWQTTSGGLWRTLDGGASWTNISSSLGITASATNGGAIVFDQSSVSGGQAQTIYAISWGQGVWQSTNGGTSFTQIANGTSSPTTAYSSCVGADGVLWLSDGNTAASGSFAWKYQSATWTSYSAGARKSVICDPNNAGTVVLNNNGALGNETLNNGTDGFLSGNIFFYNFPTGNARVTLPTDIPWLGASMNTSARDCFSPNGRFDPSGSGRLYYACGVGVFYANFPRSFTAMSLISESLGMETMVHGNDIIAPAGFNNVFFPVQDRGVFVGNAQAYPSSYVFLLSNTGLTEGWSVSAAAQGNFLVTTQQDIVNGGKYSGYSTDGSSWTPFSSQTPATSPGANGGSIAAATSLDMVWAPASNGVPFYTLDGGATWVRCQLASGGNLPSDGWNNLNFNMGSWVAADQATIGTFYLYNFVHGIYVSTDGGATWTATGTLPYNVSGPVRLRAAPGNANHIWISSGAYYQGSASVLKYSINGGTTFSTVANIDMVWDFGFGATKPGASYPTIWVMGRHNGTDAGVFYSTDMGSSWTKALNASVVTYAGHNNFVPDLHNGNASESNLINGDGSQWNKFYIDTQTNFYSIFLGSLLRRDLHHDNDNSPVFLNHVA